MRRELVGGLFGLGATVSALAVPARFPNTSSWISYWLFWGGLALMLLMILDFAWLWFLASARPSAALVANVGFVLLSAGVISQFSPSDKSDVDSPEATSAAMAQLAQLGWTVKPGDKDILFEVANRSLLKMSRGLFHLVPGSRLPVVRF